MPESLKPIKESLVSMPQLQPVKSAADDKSSNETEPFTSIPENNNEHSSGCDKYPAPSTPQLKHGVRSVDDGDCQEHTIFSTEQDSGEHDGDAKSVETTFNNTVAESTVQTSPREQQGQTIVKEENGSSPHQKMEADIATSSPSNNCPDNRTSHSAEPSKASAPHSSSGTKTNKKKMKVRWKKWCLFLIEI